MVGAGIAWASLLTMPCAFRSAARTGVCMGVINFFIVIPMSIASLTFPRLVKNVFDNNPLSLVLPGGACLLVAAALAGSKDDAVQHPPLDS